MLLYSLHQSRILTVCPCSFIDVLANFHPALPAVFVRPSWEARRNLTPSIGDTFLVHFNLVSVLYNSTNGTTYTTSRHPASRSRLRSLSTGSEALADL
jgi:hypothetical protein